LPDLNISISRFYPFKRKKMAGKERWYKKIAMSYTGAFSNSITAKEDMLMHSSLKQLYQFRSLVFSKHFDTLPFVFAKP
jgi:hypothetical protein